MFRCFKFSLFYKKKSLLTRQKIQKVAFLISLFYADSMRRKKGFHNFSFHRVFDKNLILNECARKN